jgi:hypothetical protein
MSGVRFVDASELRLAPGVWPRTLDLDGFTFRAVRTEWTVHGEVASVTYAGPKGWEVVVFND